MVETPIHIVKDIGRKAADDVSAAMNRNIALVEGLEAQLAVTAYAAATAIGWAGAVWHAQQPNADHALSVEQLFDFLRPMVLGTMKDIANA